VELLRRLPIIAFEDGLPPPILGPLTWLMVAHTAKTPLPLTCMHVNLILAATLQLASSRYRERLLGEGPRDGARAPLPSAFAPEMPYQAAPDDTGPTIRLPIPAAELKTGLTGGLMLRLVTVPDCRVREPAAERRLPPEPVVHMAANLDPTTAAPSMGAAFAADAESHWVAFDGHAAVAVPFVMT
jgi:hypothetical protein